VVLYGISTCETCKKARKALEAAGHSVTFRDVRAAPLGAEEIAEFVAAFGDAIVNRQSTTWRGLSDFLKASEPEAQLAAQPTLMKRPVIRSDAGLTLGWDDAVRARLGLPAGSDPG
jgi:Spx/MgsR family transcriptional regulator